MPRNTRQKHDRNMRTPEVLTQEEFEQDKDPQDELSTTEDEKREIAYQAKLNRGEIRYKPHRPRI